MRWKELSLTETKQLKHKCQQQCPTSTNKHLQFKNKKKPSTYSGYDKIFMKQRKIKIIHENITKTYKKADS